MSDVEDTGFAGMRFEVPDVNDYSNRPGAVFDTNVTWQAQTREDAIAARSIRKKLSGVVLTCATAGQAFGMALEFAGAKSNTHATWEQFLRAARMTWLASPAGPSDAILDQYIDP